MLRSSLSLGAAALLVFAANAAWAADGVAPAKESVPGGPLMLAAYMFIWLFPIILLWRSQKHSSSLIGVALPRDRFYLPDSIFWSSETRRSSATHQSRRFSSKKKRPPRAHAVLLS